MTSVNEILQLCRLCLVTEDVNVPIFEEQGDLRQIFLKISACLPVKVSKEDDLPKSICDGCSCKLEMLYQFWNTSASSEKKLIKLINQAAFEKANPPADKTVQHSMNLDPMILKQEVVEVADNQNSPDNLVPDDLNVSNDAQDYILQQQQLPYQNVEFQFQQDGFEETTGDDVATAVEPEAPPTRKRRAAAMRALANMGSEDEDDADLIDTKIAKTEEQSDDSGGEDPEPTAFVGLPSATDNEQPGPSGVGKTSGDAPYELWQLFQWYQVPLKPIKLPVPKEETETPPSPATTTTTRTKTTTTANGYNCPHCPKLFETKDKLWKHKSAVHTRKPIHPCKVCGKLFKYVSKAKDHENMHNSSVRFECDICNRSFKYKHSLIDHRRIDHENESRFKCQECNQAFLYKGLLESHYKKVHLGETFKCSDCNKSYKDITYFKIHQQTHLPGYVPPSLTCSECDAKFTSRQALNVHTKTHKLDRQYVCATCGKRIGSLASLRDHMNIHSGEKPFKCEECGKEFTAKNSLKVHSRTHTKEKPYSCKICSQRFTQPSTLKIHIRQHTGEKPYKCSICEKMFAAKTTLRAHMKVHKTA